MIIFENTDVFEIKMLYLYKRIRCGNIPCVYLNVNRSAFIIRGLNTITNQKVQISPFLLTKCFASGRLIFFENGFNTLSWR